MEEEAEEGFGDVWQSNQWLPKIRTENRSEIHQEAMFACAVGSGVKCCHVVTRSRCKNGRGQSRRRRNMPERRSHLRTAAPSVSGRAGDSNASDRWHQGRGLGDAIAASHMVSGISLSGARAGVPSRPSRVRRCFLTPDVRFNHKLLSRDSSARDHAPLVPQLQLPSTSHAHPTDPLYARRIPIIQR